MTTDTFSDVTLICDDQTQFRAHKVVLSSFSPVFKNMLTAASNSSNPVIYLRGIKQKQAESILQFLYLGQASVENEDIDEFINLTKEFSIQGLDRPGEESDDLDEFIKEDIDNDTSSNLYICKLQECGLSINFHSHGKRSKILSHYTTHFQLELEEKYSYLLIAIYISFVTKICPHLSSQKYGNILE